MKRFFDLYQFLGPAILTPLAVWLWWRHYGAAAPVIVAVAVPVIHAYVVPAFGTNILKMWAFNSRLRIGNFRPQHGFVFGSATAVLALPLAGTPGDGAVVRTALMLGGVLLAVNWIYDALAIRHGILEVYNQPHAEGANVWRIAGDYVVWFFGAFGLIHGAGLKLAESALAGASTPAAGLVWALAISAVTITVPSLLYVMASLLRHGHSGCRPIHRAVPETST